MKLNSLQLTALPTEGSEVTASRESSPRAMMPTERYSSILHTSLSEYGSAALDVWVGGAKNKTCTAIHFFNPTQTERHLTFDLP